MAAGEAAAIQSELDQLIALGSQEFVQGLVASQGVSIASVPIPTIIEARELLVAATRRAQDMKAHAGEETVGSVTLLADEALVSMDAFLARPGTESFAAFSENVTAVRARAAELRPQLVVLADQHQDSLRRVILATRWLLVGAAIVSGAIISTTTFLLGRRLAHGREALRKERDSLVEASRVMNRRNSQFRALYQVVTEVSESLSTRYVVNTAVQEAAPLVDADLVALRLLSGGELTIAGIQSAPDLEIGQLAPVALGAGLTGRSAKRGKTIAIAENAASEMAPEERVPTIQSGVVVPLIVGARVVGTMGCWSRQPGHFSEDDERILEMMASQVATAVAAADTHEVSEKNAHMDALTGLANRRQLAEDVSGFVADKMLHQEPLTIAMIDVDNFGLFNKDYGHRVGDITLQKVAHVLKNALREKDRVYRYGGEEFLIALDSSLIEAQDVVERLRRAVADAPLTGENMEPIGPVTISIGLAAFPAHGDRYEEIVSRADEALRAAKRQGRNRVMLWSHEVSLSVAA